MATYFVGLMSGTSMDGIDAVVCEFRDTQFQRVAAHASLPYAPDLRARLLALQRGLPAITLQEFAALDQAVARHFADAARAAIAAAGQQWFEISAIGSHGQTVFHEPAGVGSSLQLGNPSWIAQTTNITTVADFRRSDVALGGQGAPLVPAFHHAALADRMEARVVVNLGGIANITILPDLDPAAVRGFDTGPGNGLMDEWAERHLGTTYDADGAFASAGRVHAELLDSLLGDPYFDSRPPKSTGRSDFNLDWVLRRYPALEQIAPADVQSTLCELTARSVADAIRRQAPQTENVLLCGGGIANGALRARLQALLAPARVTSTADAGLDPRWVEAAAFAWLAMRTLNGLPGNLPAVTGARKPAVLGGIYRS
jgi:anhydro-N-acetylmuramic acid kinase